jgi:hypothetical protein
MKKEVGIARAKWSPKIIPATLPCRGTEDFESISIPGLTPEEFDRIWEETRRDWTDKCSGLDISTSTDEPH